MLAGEFRYFGFRGFENSGKLNPMILESTSLNHLKHVILLK
jgi:hypothetical protein